MFDLFRGLFGAPNNTEIIDAIKGGAFIVDVRTPGEYSFGSVKGATNIPLDKIPSQISKFKGKNSVIVFCRSGARSGQAKSFLEQHGVQNVINAGTVGAMSSCLREMNEQ